VIGSDDAAGIAFVAFDIGGRQIRLRIPLPTEASFRAEEPRGWRRWAEARRRDWVRARLDQISRERWRALVLLVKAKLELVELGLSTLEREFLADVVLPDGQTVGEWVSPQIERAYEAGTMPPLLPAARGGS
jgi:hypothetical protein